MSDKPYIIFFFKSNSPYYPYIPYIINQYLDKINENYLLIDQAIFEINIDKYDKKRNGINVKSR